MYYTTLSQVKSDLGLSSSETTDDALLTRWIRLSSKFIELYKGRRYDIRKETINFDTPLTDIGDNAYLNIAYNGGGSDLVGSVLRVYEDLVSVDELTNGDGVVIPSTEYVLLKRHLYPKFAIKLKPFSDYVFELDDDGNPEDAIEVNGYWGYVNPATCWIDSGDKITGTGINSSDTVIICSDVSGVAGDLLSPRFEAGQMIKIEDEFLFITEVDTATNNLTVTRGYNGTTAVEHLIDTIIYVFRPNDIIVQMATRLVSWRYRQKDVDNFDKVFNFAEKSISIPSALPADVQAMLGSRKTRML